MPNKRSVPQPQRRTVLRAAGITMALPVLDVVIGPDLEAKEPKGGAAQPTPRMVFVFNPLGPSNEYWHPAETGSNYKLTASLEPLAPIRSKLTVLSGPAHCQIPTGAGHEMVSRMLTGFSPEDNHHAPVKRMSIDQIAANAIGQSTRYPSLQIAVAEGSGPVVHSHTMSFNHAGRALPSIKKTKDLFKRLFVSQDAGSQAQADRRFAERTSMLDEMHDQLKHLNKVLGKADQQRIEHYQDSIRQVEKQLERDQEWSKIAKPKVSAQDLDLEPPSRINWIDTMNEITRLALLTDSTRIVSMLWGVERDGYNWKEAKAGSGHHGLQHHNGSKRTLEALHRVDKIKIEALERFCTSMAKTEVPGGNLLDQTMMWYGYGLNNGGPGYKAGKGVHYTRDLSHLVLGGAAFGFKHGKHLRYKSTKMPLSNLWITMLQKAGVEIESFVDSTGQIDDLLRA